jgi:hypothetical protein
VFTTDKEDETPLTLALPVTKKFILGGRDFITSFPNLSFSWTLNVLIALATLDKTVVPEVDSSTMTDFFDATPATTRIFFTVGVIIGKLL